MKGASLIAAAVLALMATPAAAEGYLGIEYGNGELSGGGPPLDGDGWAGEGAFGFNGSGWGAQLDGSFGHFEADSHEADTMTLGGHLWWRPTDNFRIGAVATMTQFEESGDEFDERAYGIEGAYDFNEQFQLIASATSGEVDEVDLDTSNFDATLNFYPNPNVRVGGSFGTGNLDGSGGDADTTSYGVSGEFQPWAFPVSITAGWNTFEIEDGVDTDVFQVGARWNFGGGTLRDRNNATPFDTNTGFFNRLLGIW